MSKLHFLVLATGQQDKLINVIEQRGHTYEIYNPNDVYLYVSSSENGYDCVYDGNQELTEPKRLKANAYDAVISRIGDSLNHGTCILRHINENLGIYSTQDADGLLTASNKLKTTQKLSYRGLRVPKTIYAKNPVHVDFLLKKVDGLPAIAKLLQGSQGVGVNILETPLATNTMLESFSKSNIDLKIQKFIKANGKDIRAIVVGDKVAVAMERTANKGDFRANISKNGSGRKVELSEEDKDICIRSAKAVGLEFAGVDIMKDDKGKTFVIEVNGNPGTKIIDLTGHNYFVDLVKMVEEKVGKIENKEDNTDEASTSNRLVGNTKVTLFRQKVDPYEKLSEQEIARIENINRLKSKYPILMKDLDI
ncbi:ribosomal protein S6--L-glutamate ligase [Spirosoma fluviale]|uniref:Ribosomal protein S6--L-glutamate ligase n=2 Tax=Spirosoma fluviale TaxID=1597977 RepID=A0A286FZ97_9BACT|nr:ribosomal protein S6--L-glutamate ligase [Spirosoma fluviale]